MSDRDKFLTEAMGECWHESGNPSWTCKHCGKRARMIKRQSNPDFSTWEGFGKLWEWVVDQEWFCLMMAHNGCGPHDIVNPDLFANEVYKFVKKEK